MLHITFVTDEIIVFDRPFGSKGLNASIIVDGNVDQHLFEKATTLFVERIPRHELRDECILFLFRRVARRKAISVESGAHGRMSPIEKLDKWSHIFGLAAPHNDWWRDIRRFRTVCSVCHVAVLHRCRRLFPVAQQR